LIICSYVFAMDALIISHTTIKKPPAVIQTADGKNQKGNLLFL